MNFNKHYELEGKHAFLGASKYHWLNYDRDKLISTFRSNLAVIRGTKLHELASALVKMHVKLPKSKKTLNMYVNDAIDYHMTTEQPLYFSRNCFGTADSISFRNDILRISDLKTGDTPAHMEQLMIYSALFCLEYMVDPNSIRFILRIYQNDEITEQSPEPNDIIDIMNRIREFDAIIEEIRTEEDE